MSSKSAVYTEGYKRAPDPAITHELVNSAFEHIPARAALEAKYIFAYQSSLPTATRSG